MEIEEIRENIEKLPQLIEDAEFRFLKNKAELEYMQDLKKNILAIQKQKANTKTRSEAEDYAFASEEYVIHVKGIFEKAVEVAKYSAKFHLLQNTFEAMRSLNKNV